MRNDSNRKNKGLDSTVEIVAPENVAFEYRLAGPFIRASAFAVDAAIIGAEIVAVLAAAAYCASLFGGNDVAEEFAQAAFLLNFCAVFWFWNAAFEAFWRGRTIGKAAFGLRVLTTEGRPIGRGQALLRNVLRAADLALGPFLAILFCANDRMARFGDLAAGTVVVVEKRSPKKTVPLAPVDRAALERIAAEIPSDFDVPDSLRKALALYVERRTEISPSRRAAIAAPLAAALAQKANLARSVDPDVFLRALFLRTFEEKRNG
ncbi:MAG: RDD family protein [Thermoguttaceae bacterium]|nr:RDD family protein [Thermoguttaceae bacterium]